MPRKGRRRAHHRAGHVHPARSRAGPPAPHQRRERHHPGDVDAADTLRARVEKPVTFLHYALTESDMLYRDELEELARTAPGVRLVRVFTDEPGTGDLDGFLSPSSSTAPPRSGPRRKPSSAVRRL
jgi:hypothetical protein